MDILDRQTEIKMAWNTLEDPLSCLSHVAVYGSLYYLSFSSMHKVINLLFYVDFVIIYQSTHLLKKCAIKC